MSDSETQGERDPLLEVKVSCPGGYKPFGDMSAAEVRARADELGQAAGVGALAQRVAPVASAWRGLADEMEREGAAQVDDLDEAGVVERAGRLWIEPPGGSLL